MLSLKRATSASPSFGGTACSATSPVEDCLCCASLGQFSRREAKLFDPTSLSSALAPLYFNVMTQDAAVMAGLGEAAMNKPPTGANPDFAERKKLTWN